MMDCPKNGGSAYYNSPFAEHDNVLGYHLATLRWMASHPSILSENKALSAIERSLRVLIQAS